MPKDVDPAVTAMLGWDMVMQLGDRSERIDSIVIQMGGGALALSAAQAFEEALQLGFIDALTRIHVCRPEGGFPFARAYLLALAEILSAGTIRDAYEKAKHHTGIPVCPTGASGLAGLIQLQASGASALSESVGLFFTGFDRPRAE